MFRVSSEGSECCASRHAGDREPIARDVSDHPLATVQHSSTGLNRMQTITALPFFSLSARHSDHFQAGISSETDMNRIGGPHSTNVNETWR